MRTYVHLNDQKSFILCFFRIAGHTPSRFIYSYSLKGMCFMLLLDLLFSSSDERHPRPGKRQREDDDEEAEEDLNESNYDEVTPSLYDLSSCVTPSLCNLCNPLILFSFLLGSLVVCYPPILPSFFLSLSPNDMLATWCCKM